MLNFISYLKTLRPDDWDVKVTSKWTVKDVVAHMVGWEKRSAEVIKITWETKRLPRWMTSSEEYDDFNRKNIEYYRNRTPADLISEWESWQEKIQEEIDRIGEDNLKSRSDLFGWFFGKEKGNRPEDYTNKNHYEHHYRQIRKALELTQTRDQ
ncbi:MAG TPA: maleylpyruvate isomerase N-terminal domain-containing protein [Candidatus Tyrphobacter sp.]|nr:maleylpyruvate isomerase N-terminal domain-containing protein [Candidatus Tyrphobacter sp.]